MNARDLIAQKEVEKSHYVDILLWFFKKLQAVENQDDGELYVCKILKMSYSNLET